MRSEIHISASPSYIFKDTQQYDIESKHGYIASLYRPDNGFYQIADFEIQAAARGNGHGQELLRATRLHAEELGARIIFAAIISRECYEVMHRVFGEEGLEISQLGDFAPEGQDRNTHSPTNASLFHQIDPLDKTN